MLKADDYLFYNSYAVFRNSFGVGRSLYGVGTNVAAGGGIFGDTCYGLNCRCLAMRLLKLPTPLFTRAELWFHLLLAPVLHPATNGILVGERYFEDFQVFAVATLTLLGLQTVAVLILTVLIKSIIARYSDLQQAQRRNVTALVAGALVTAGLAVWVVWVYSQIPLLRTTFTINVVLYTVGLGIVVALFLGYVLIVTDTYTRWHQNQTEKEQLRQLTMQQQVDALKGQINPHFLFNSLNSISSLIADEPQRAEAFVDEMAKVYRYLLQTNRRTNDGPDGSGDLTTLSTELGFIQSYFHLLKTRHGSGIQLTVMVNDADLARRLPPLTLQMLVENAVKHNVIHASKPLFIEIKSGVNGQLLVRNNLQRKTPRSNRRAVLNNQVGLSNITAKYRLLAQRQGPPTANTGVVVDEADAYFTVTLPLLSEHEP